MRTREMLRLFLLVAGLQQAPSRWRTLKIKPTIRLRLSTQSLKVSKRLSVNVTLKEQLFSRIVS